MSKAIFTEEQIRAALKLANIKKGVYGYDVEMDTEFFLLKLRQLARKKTKRTEKASHD